jgi:CrcB protein
VTRPDADLVDPDADVRVPTRQGEPRTTPWPVLAAVSAGGVVGALARHGLQQALPHRPGGFGWVTFGINVSGCLLMGVLMVLITEVWTGNPLLRPFLGVGVLGGFTTFSTYVLEVQQAIGAGAWHTGLLYATGTPAGALAAVWLGVRVARRAIRPRGPVRDRPGRRRPPHGSLMIRERHRGAGR